MPAKERIHGKIRIGVGGWTYEPWRGAFYPKGLAQSRELEYASSKTDIDRDQRHVLRLTEARRATQSGATRRPTISFSRSRDPRFATNRRVLAEAGESIERFFKSGVTNLGAKLGPDQLAIRNDEALRPGRFRCVLEICFQRSVDGFAIRHVVEVRHDSFRTPEFIALTRSHGVAVVIAGESSSRRSPT